MSVIVPAILEKTKEGFMDRMSRIIKLPGLSRIQVDFGDGIFVPNQILLVAEIDSLNPAFVWEAHLMIKEPQDFLDYQISGFKILIVHYEAYAKSDDLKQALRTIRQLGLKAGLAINPPTEVSVFKDFEGLLDQFLIMSVNPGFQGQKFIDESISRIKQLRELIPNAIIEVDGGVSLSNIKQIAQAGCDLISVGSALTKADDMAATYEQLQREINTISETLIEK